MRMQVMKAKGILYITSPETHGPNVCSFRSVIVPLCRQKALQKRKFQNLVEFVKFLLALPPLPIPPLLFEYSMSKIAV